MPTVICATSLIWDTVPFMMAEQAWLPLLNPGGVETAWQGAVHGTTFKGLLCAMSGWDKSPVWHQNPEEFQGKIQLASISAGAGDPQLKPPPPWECQLLAPKQPLQCTVYTEGITLHGPFVYEALGGKGVKLKQFSV